MIPPIEPQTNPEPNLPTSLQIDLGSESTAAAGGPRPVPRGAASPSLALLLSATLAPFAAWAGTNLDAPAAPARHAFDLELLASSQGRNVAQAPNDASATRFSLDSLAGSGPYLAPRLQFAWPAGARSEWRVLLAPLSLSEDGRSSAPIRFQGSTFAVGPLQTRYQFNSWRATWRWRWIEREDLAVKLGFTAKVRDASIRLRQGSAVAEKSNTGFVPLLHASFERPLAADWTLGGDIDALAGGPGYAVDAGLRITRRVAQDWSVGASVRYLDGGADNDEVYAFARFTSVGVVVRWQPR